MKNSICLPIPTAGDSPHIHTRCFVVFEQGSREMPAFPFTVGTLRKLNKIYKDMAARGEGSPEFYCSLFFPEGWPPELIRDYLYKDVWQENLLAS